MTVKHINESNFDHKFSHTKTGKLDPSFVKSIEPENLQFSGFVVIDLDSSQEFEVVERDEHLLCRIFSGMINIKRPNSINSKYQESIIPMKKN